MTPLSRSFGPRWRVGGVSSCLLSKTRTAVAKTDSKISSAPLATPHRCAADAPDMRLAACDSIRNRHSA
jgi:hypothetical protein